MYVDDLVVVELLDPVEGTTDVLELVPQWWSEWSVQCIGIDPRSPSSTLVDPLKAKGMQLKLADAVGVAVANGAFQDLLNARRLKLRGHDALNQAARRATTRRLAGSFVVDRYAGAGSAALLAAQLACWALPPAGSGEPGVYWV
jgi:hypothetical protein